jgi:2-methylcitrate dehydratase PrpD
MPFSIAAALADGEVTSDTFEDGRFLDRDVLELIGKMRIEIHPEYSKLTPGLRNCRIEAELESGEKVVALHVLSQADIERETPDDVIDAKFRNLTLRLLPRAARKRLAAEIARLDTLERVDSIIELMVI